MVVKHGIKFILSENELGVIKEVCDSDVYRVRNRSFKTVVDIGAHKGIFSLFCASLGASVWAFEPVLVNYDALLRHIEINSFKGQIKPHRAAIRSNIECAHSTVVNVRTGIDSSSIFTDANDIRSEVVTSINIDAVLEEVKRTDVLKLDCEGAEFEILNAASDDLLSTVSYICAELHLNYFDDGQLPAKLYDDMIYKLRNMFDIDGAFMPDGRYSYIHCTNKNLK